MTPQLNPRERLMPAEFDPHTSVWLAWPTDDITFINRLPQVREAVARMIRALRGSERVELLVADENIYREAKEFLKKRLDDFSHLTFHTIPYIDVWIRDYGPLFILQRPRGGKKQSLAMVDWQYNAYGKADEWYFGPLIKDDRIPKLVNAFLKLTRLEPGIVLEGGAIDVNGRGLCLTTEECLLNPNRNTGMTQEMMEQYLKDYLGIEKTIWLKRGLVNDHTDGHVDEVARFVNPTTVVCALEDNPADENYAILLENHRMLTAATDHNGDPLTVITLPMPHMKYTDQEKIKYEKSDKAPVSYANFYIGNTVVLTPTFHDPNDESALRILRSVFPSRRIIPIECHDLIYGGGGIHCITQQQPALAEASSHHPKM